MVAFISKDEELVAVPVSIVSDIGNDTSSFKDLIVAGESHVEETILFVVNVQIFLLLGSDCGPLS